MGLSLLAPAILGLALLGALPLIAHMSRQTPRERQQFGAMLLLERVVKRLRRRRRVKDWLLLLLRLLALALLLIGFAGPRFSYPGGIPEFGGSGRVVLLVDHSLSMSLMDGGSTLLDQARTRAAEVLDDLPPGTLVGLVVFSDDALRLTPTLTQDLGRVADRVAEIQPTSGTSNLREALLDARRLLGGEPGEILLFSDEAGPRIVTEAITELERVVALGSAVIPMSVRADPPRNVAITSASYGDGIEGGQVTLRITNFGPSAIEVPCEVILPDGAAIPILADLPPDGEAEERITVPREALGGVGVAHCEDPDLKADDSRFFHLPRIGAARVLVVDGNPGDTPTQSEVYFLERALAPWGGLKSGVSAEVTPPGGLLELDPQSHRVVFLANVSDPRPVGPRLREFVRKGGAVVISGGDNVTAERYNAALGGILPAAIRKVRALADPTELGVPLMLPDTRVELFAPFSRSGRSGFSRVRAHTVLTLEPYEETDEVRTLLRYEGGMPALVERKVGRGRVLVWTSTFDMGWCNLPLQAVFMPLVQRTVAYLGGDSGATAGRFDAIVGERVSIPLPDIVLEPEVIGPNDEPVASRIEGSALLFTPKRAGAYAVTIESAPPLAWVAVNTAPEESDVRQYDTVARAEAEIHPELFQKHVDLSRPLFGGGLSLLALSALLAMGGAVRRES